MARREVNALDADSGRLPPARTEEISAVGSAVAPTRTEERTEAAEMTAPVAWLQMTETADDTPGRTPVAVGTKEISET